jgi:hypothetical protein
VARAIDPVADGCLDHAGGRPVVFVPRIADALGRVVEQDAAPVARTVHALAGTGRIAHALQVFYVIAGIADAAGAIAQDHAVAVTRTDHILAGSIVEPLTTAAQQNQ